MSDKEMKSTPLTDELYKRWQTGHKDFGKAEGIIDLYSRQLTAANEEKERVTRLAKKTAKLLDESNEQLEQANATIEKYKTALKRIENLAYDTEDAYTIATTALNSEVDG